MAACTRQHNIKLVKCGGVTHRSLIRLFGYVENICENSCVEIRRSNDEKVWRVLLFSKRFKLLIRLIHDCENDIELKYCNAAVKMIFKHKSIEKVCYDVQPLYIINRNSDGRFQSTSDDKNNGIEAALRKIDLALELAACVISTKFDESQFGERTFKLNTCKEFYSDLDASEARNMNQWELYDAIATELISKQDTSRRKFVCFLSCTKFEGLEDGEKYSYVNIKSKTFANPSLGGGFFCLMGSGCFYSWPNNVDEVVEAFTNKKEVNLKEVLDDSNYRKTYGGCFATSLGSLIHEIGHVFDLAHTTTGLMGNDIDYTHRFFLNENFTEILPKRIIGTCQLQDQISEKRSGDQRFTKLKKPGGTFLNKYYEQKENDLTFFEPNCLITLFCHRWFTQAQIDGCNLEYIKETRTIISKANPIQLVELRELESSNAMLIKFWSLFEKNVNEFQIPSNEKVRNVTIFAITSQGEILKTNVTN